MRQDDPFAPSPPQDFSLKPPLGDQSDQNSEEGRGATDNHSDYWGMDSGSPGIGIYANWKDTPENNPEQFQENYVPATKWQAASSNFQLGISSPWNLTADAYHGIGLGYDYLVHGSARAHAYWKDIKSYQDALNDTVERLPRDEQSWLNGWAPRMLGSVLDPATLGIAKAGEVGVKLVAPEALSSLTAAAGLGGESLSLSQKIMKGSIEGSVHGAVGGAASGGVAVAYQKLTGQKVTFGDYMENLGMWTGMGGLGGGIGSAIGHYLHPDAEPDEPVSAEKSAVDISNLNVTSQDAIDSVSETAGTQYGASSSIDGQTSFKAALNQSKAELEAKQKIFESYDPQTVKSQNIRSPYDQLQDRIDQLNDAKEELTNNAAEHLNKIKAEASDDGNIISSKNFADRIGGISLSKLMVSLRDLDSLKSTMSHSQDLLKEVRDGIDHHTPSVGPASRVRTAIRELPELVSPEDKEFFARMAKPEEELKELSNYKADVNDGHKEEINRRVEALTKIKENPKLKKWSSTLDDSISQLHSISENLDAVNDYHAISQNLNKTLRAPMDDVDTSAAKTARDLNDPMNSIDHSSSSMPLEEMAKDDRPYSEAQNEMSELDGKIQHLKEQGWITDDDLKQVAEVDESLEHDKGVNSILSAISSCILRNG